MLERSWKMCSTMKHYTMYFTHQKLGTILFCCRRYSVIPLKLMWTLTVTDQEEKKGYCSWASRESRNCWGDSSKKLYQVLHRVNPVHHAPFREGSICSLWHQRLGHCSNEVSKASSPHERGVDETRAHPAMNCAPCATGKFPKFPCRAVPRNHSLGARAFY